MLSQRHLNQSSTKTHFLTVASRPSPIVVFLQRVGTAGREDDGHDPAGARGSEREVRGAARRAETNGSQLGVLGKAAGEGTGREGASNAHQGELTVPK